MRIGIALVVSALAAACTTAPPPADIEYSESDRDRKLICDADAVQSYVGAKADAEVGEKVIRESSSRTLRWGAPDSAWTMDYREDRVNVRYDRSMTITDITCG